MCNAYLHTYSGICLKRVIGDGNSKEETNINSILTNRYNTVKKYT